MGADIAAVCQAEVTILGIKETGGKSETILVALRRSQQLLEDRKIVTELVVKSGNPIEEIVKRTQEVNYDLVVIGAERKGRHGPFSMSAKAYKIVKRVKPPVLIVVGAPRSLKRLLICSGGKGYIENSFQLVGKIALGTGASIALLHIMPEPPPIYSGIRKLELDVDRVLNSNSELGRNLRKEKELLTAQGIPTEVRLRHGFVLDEISREIQSGGYDLIVAGSSLSTGPLRTYVLGDVTREIVNRADCPVLIARHGARPRNLREILSGLIHGFTVSNSPRASEQPSKA